MTSYKMKDKIINEILESSKGHQITYEYHDEDGSVRSDKAIPIGYFKEWLKVALIKSHTSLIEKVGEVIGEDENLYEKERNEGLSDWRVERENGANELRGLQRKKLDDIKKLGEI